MASLQPCVISRERGPQSGAGGCTARASNDTPPRQAAVWWSGHRFGQFVSLRMTVCCPPTSSSRAGLPVVMSDRYSSLMKRRVERSPATMELATFQSEISPLRSAFVEMTGRYHIFLHGPFGFRADAETVPSFTGLYQQRGEKAGPKSFLCRSAQSMEAERGGQKPS